MDEINNLSEEEILEIQDLLSKEYIEATQAVNILVLAAIKLLETQDLPELDKDLIKKSLLSLNKLKNDGSDIIIKVNKKE